MSFKLNKNGRGGDMSQAEQKKIGRIRALANQVADLEELSDKIIVLLGLDDDCEQDLAKSGSRLERIFTSAIQYRDAVEGNGDRSVAARELLDAINA